ncbi:sulfur relay protein TusB/DsrH [Sinobacterium caligoides]|uniref:Sulfur relay protein TusB/DsrH n=1 Tax=Sinobacterium caligoides TaxID=933926 RepID=A0A3N2DJW6_9GAMM|nr:sulfur relay protein TusB/DsrH [Sinobacterium caligoides]
MTLHIVSQSPYHGSALKECLNYIAEDDTLLLIGEGVYSCQGEAAELINTLSCPVFVLATDRVARGIKTKLPDVDYAGFVTLTSTHNKSISWF